VIESPCNKVCVMNEQTGFCRGCYRTLDEIACWGMMSDEEKEDVIGKLAGRATRSGATEVRDR
jgi:predicted Fe-S protein YdhL (DUF1289 family)